MKDRVPRPAKSKSSRSAAAGRRAAAAAPGSAVDRVVLEIRRFIAAATFFNAQTAERAGLGLTDVQMINVLQFNGPSTPGQLATWTGLSSGGVTVALDRLERAGYIRRGANPADRRSLLVTLAPARIRGLARLYEDVEKETRRLLAGLPDRDLDAVIRFFEAMRAGRTNAAS